ncbi:non-homologous end-joining DNA ligase [Nocardia farcinica]|uniref:non-homologous end-joining DNA ligase n=1 Tax=Nocardia farcinica TaxID=37329 RepID=UPI002457BD33|nr:non-homologous end-joining DNA ligase [Nocardia farcinica]
MVRVPAPMLATAGQPPRPGTGWAYELKWDGQRALARITPTGCQIWSRNLREITASYPDISAALTAAAPGHDELLLDGEIVALDPAQVPSFARLQRRMHVTRPTPALLAAVPAHYVVFDVLALDDTSTMEHPYSRRRALLERLHLRPGRIHVPPNWLDTDPAELLAAAAETRAEGIVSKRLDAPYRPGRSRAWIKTALRRTSEVVLIGWLPGRGEHAGTLGSLIAGAHDQHGRLRFVGCIGTGFTMAARRALRAALDQLACPDSPLDEPVAGEIAATAHWSDPVLVADIDYREITEDGILRHPSFRGIRADRTPDEVALPPI